MLRNLKFEAVPIHGQMDQPKRLGALAKFKAGERAILVATDVAARGLDIPTVRAVWLRFGGGERAGEEWAELAIC